MFDETQAKIIQATMNLVMEKGYSSTTTKDIALHAGINECTIFRKFHGKKDIVLSAMQLQNGIPGWRNLILPGAATRKVILSPSPRPICAM